MPRHWNPTSFQIFVEWFIGARCFSSMMIIWYCKMAKCGQKCILLLRPALRTVHSRPRLRFLFRNLTNYMVLLFFWSEVGAFCKMFFLEDKFLILQDGQMWKKMHSPIAPPVLYDMYTICHNNWICSFFQKSVSVLNYFQRFAIYRLLSLDFFLFL